MQSRNITKIKRTQKQPFKSVNVDEKYSKHQDIKKARRNKRLTQELNF